MVDEPCEELKTDKDFMRIIIIIYVQNIVVQAITCMCKFNRVILVKPFRINIVKKINTIIDSKICFIQ